MEVHQIHFLHSSQAYYTISGEGCPAHKKKDFSRWSGIYTYPIWFLEGRVEDFSIS